jgi:hypothetical protein
MEFKLSLPGTFADQSLYERGQVGNEQQHFQALLAARTCDIQAQPNSQILGVAKRLLDAHPLRVQPDVLSAPSVSSFTIVSPDFLVFF